MDQARRCAALFLVTALCACPETAVSPDGAMPTGDAAHIGDANAGTDALFTTDSASADSTAADLGQLDTSSADASAADTLLPDLGRRILSWMAEEAMPAKVNIAVRRDGSFAYLADDEELPESERPLPEPEADETGESVAEASTASDPPGASAEDGGAGGGEARTSAPGTGGPSRGGSGDEPEGVET